jgi:hypothetical protein
MLLSNLPIKLIRRSNCLVLILFVGKAAIQGFMNRLKKFPFCIVYYFEDALNQVVVASIFHDKRNPAKKLRNKT